MSDAMMDGYSEMRYNIMCEASDKTIEKHAGIKAFAIENFKRNNSWNQDTIDTLRRIYTCLCQLEYKKVTRDIRSINWSYSVNRPMYYFFHTRFSQPTVGFIKSHFGYKKRYCVITAEELFTNFNNKSENRLVGAFTHCLYMLATHENANSNQPVHPIDSDCYIIVTDIDDFDPEDGFQGVAGCISRDNLCNYFDDGMKELKHDASQVNIVFICRNLPKILLWWLAQTSNVNKWKFVPDVTDSAQFQHALEAVIKEKWQLVNVNCGRHVTEKIQSIMQSQNLEILTWALIKTLQIELNLWYPGWRVCWMKNAPIWTFPVPCLVYRKSANHEVWFLVFYAPLKWHDKFQSKVAYGCDDRDKVQEVIETVELSGVANNTNNMESEVNIKLDYHISLLLHQSVAGIGPDILANNREAYRNISLPKKEEEVTSEMDDNKYWGKKTETIYCSRNAVTYLENRQISVVNAGPFKSVTIV